MPPSSRRARVSIIEHLRAEPQNFSFSQAIRLLERSAILPGNNQEPTLANMELPVARFSPPTKEVMHFHNSQSLRFPESEISDITLKKTGDNGLQWQVLVNFIGMSGAMGIMPFHYTEMILQRLKARDLSIADFLDLFHHRTTSLFFQASNKYRLPIEYERSKLHTATKAKDCKHTQALLSLLGLGTKNLRNRLQIRDESLIFYSGLLTLRAKTPTGLKQIIEGYFGVPADIDSFIGQWQQLIDDVRTRLPWNGNRKGQNAQLGRSCMLGQKGWFAQGKSRIKIGPLDSEQFEKFAPGTGALKALNEIVSVYLGTEQSFDFVIEVIRDDIPQQVRLKKDKPPLLSWNTWLSGRPKTHTDKDELLQILVSSKKLK